MKAHLDKGLTYLLPNLTGFVFCLFFLASILFGPRMMNMDGDLGRHISIGEYILANQSIPVNDLFSHTKFGDPVTPHEWLSQLIFALSNRWFGLNGVVVVTALLIGITYAWIFHFSSRKSGSPLSALVFVILAAAAGSIHWLTRPHIFTILLLVICYDLLDRLVKGSKAALWVLPLVMLVWVNLHGAFIAGFVLWAGFTAGVIWDRWFTKAVSPDIFRKQLFPLLAVGLFFTLVSLINPAGWRIWETSVGYLRNSYLVSHTAEYLPPDFHQSSTWPFLFLICASIFLTGILRPRIPSYMAVLVAGWTAMALVSMRNIPLYGVIVCPLLAIGLQSGRHLPIFYAFFKWDDKIIGTEKMIKGWLFPILIVGSTIFLFYRGMALDIEKRGNQFLADNFPVDAVNWLEENPQDGNMFNYFPWGGYLLYRLWPDQLVFIDGQTDFYGEELTRVYESILTTQPEWEIGFQEYDIEWVIFPNGERLIRELISLEEWKPIYEDSVAVILRRVKP